VEYARKILEGHYKGEEPEPPRELKDLVTEKRGCFVTLKKHPSSDLRGCIGYTEPIYPLKKSLKKAALGAALNDPRFPQVREEELDSLTVEVSVLTNPELIQVDEPGEYPEKIMVGRDGLIVEKGPRKGLLLPQVPVEQGWGVKEFLNHTCMKAGLTPDQWLNTETRIYAFQAQVYRERSPEGEVRED